MILSIAWKNIWRNKTRSLVVMFAIALGIVGGTFCAAFIFGVSAQKIKDSINKEVSHIQIHNPKYLENNETQYAMDDADSVCNYLRHFAQIKGITKRTKIPGMVNYASYSSGVQIIGVNPNEEKQTTTIYKAICDSCGNYFEGVKRNPVVISKKLAEKLNVRLHSKIVLRFPLNDGSIQSAAFKVAGIYQTTNTNFDLMNVFVRNTDLADSNGVYFKTHEIAVVFNNEDSLSVAKQKLISKFPNLSVMTYKEIEPQLGMIDSMIEIELYIILGIILFALAFGIVNTMLMVVYERIRELGMLMAIGMSKARIFKMIVLETVMLTLTGGIVGIIGGLLLISATHKSGIDLSAVSQGLEAFGFDSMVYPEIRLDFFFNLTLMIIATGFLASLYPARQALKMNPVEAIREE